MATPIEFVEEQWQAWIEKNPLGTYQHIDQEKLVGVLTKDLTYASGMDVKEYTLYQKWCEIKERYPVQEVPQKKYYSLLANLQSFYLFLAKKSRPFIFLRKVVA